MRIDKLRLQNFRSYRDLTMLCDRLNIVRGPNGAGKTSIQLAIEYALTGRCAMTDARGAGAEDLTRLGASSFEVELELYEGACRIQAGRSRLGSNLLATFRNEGQSQQLAGQAGRGAIEANLGSRDLLAAVLNSYRFVQMNPAEQRALLAASLAAEPVLLPQEIKQQMTDATGSYSNQVTAAAEVDAEYKRFYDLRAGVNREIKAFGDITEPQILTDCPTAEQIAEKLAGLQRDRTAIVERKALKEANHRAAGTAAQNSRATRERLQLELKQHEGEQIETGEEMEQLAKLAKKKPQADKLDAEVTNLQDRLNAARDMVARLRTAMQPDACELCGRPFDAEDNTAEIAQLEKTGIPALDRELQEKQQARTKLGDPATAQQRLDKHREAMTRAGAIRNELDQIGAATAPEPLDLTTELAELAAIDQRIQKGQGIQTQVNQHAGARRQYQDTIARRETLQKKANDLDRLCEYFGPNGNLKAKLIGGRLPGFLERINAVLDRFGFACRFTLEPYNLAVFLYEQQHLGLSLHQLSESQQYRFGVAFQVALGEATGVRLVVIDHADMLTPDTRRLLTEELFNSELDQAFILATSTEPVPADLPEGVRFFDLSNAAGETTLYSDSGAPAEAAHAAVQ